MKPGGGNIEVYHHMILRLPEALPFMEEKIDVMGNELATSFGKYGFYEPYIDGERPIEVFKSKFRLWLANYTTTMVSIRLLAAGEGNFVVVVDEGKHILDKKQFLVLAHRGKAVENVMALPSCEIARQLVAAPEGDTSSLVAIVLEPQRYDATALEDAGIAGAEVSVGTVLEDADIAGAVVAVGTVLEDANIAVVAVLDDLQSWMHSSILSVYVKGSYGFVEFARPQEVAFEIRDLDGLLVQVSFSFPFPTQVGENTVLLSSLSLLALLCSPLRVDCVAASVAYMSDQKLLILSKTLAWTNDVKQYAEKLLRLLFSKTEEKMVEELERDHSFPLGDCTKAYHTADGAIHHENRIYL
ncbi:hypothetical protein SELMODRAFT_402465 [Selaginella moellendorffii]|uniref:Uncharacterized protein n=1 Tax=Selaginella moellendorffii TaxID=88036 RepID=D8QQQ8_SELML|nr:hypothetical protein SELMODRAFT_402465 [Selaginella moellendorffii]